MGPHCTVGSSDAISSDQFDEVQEESRAPPLSLAAGRDEFPLSAFLRSKTGDCSGGKGSEQRRAGTDLPELVREELLHRFVMGEEYTRDGHFGHQPVSVSMIVQEHEHAIPFEMTRNVWGDELNFRGKMCRLLLKDVVTPNQCNPQNTSVVFPPSPPSAMFPPLPWNCSAANTGDAPIPYAQLQLLMRQVDGGGRTWSLSPGGDYRLRRVGKLFVTRASCSQPHLLCSDRSQQAFAFSCC